MLSSFDILLIAVAFIIMVMGFYSRRQRWMQGKKENSVKKCNNSTGIVRTLLYLISHQKIMENRIKGIPHLFIFWGVLLPILIIIIAQFKITLPLIVARGISLLMDIVGFGAIVSIGSLIVIKLRNKSENAKQKTFMHLWLLLAIMLTGFLIEGIRLSIVPSDIVWSPVGFTFSLVLPGSPILLNILTRGHFFLVLLFIACLPFSVMRHAFAAFLNVYYQNNESKEDVKILSLEGDVFGAGATADFTWKQLLAVDACVECGRCEQNCPAFISEKALSPQKTIIQKIHGQMDEAYKMNGRPSPARQLIQGTDKWSCTTCLSCANACPVFVNPLEKLIELRRYSVLMESDFPSEYKQIFKNLEIFGDSLGHGPLMREEWISHMNINKIYETNENPDVLLWTGCQGALDERNRETTIAAVEILNKAGIKFGILGKAELCCGDPALRMGNEYLFQKLAEENIKLLKKYGVKKLTTYCPHCFNVFKREYAQFDKDFEVVYFVDFIKQLIVNKNLKVESEIEDKLTYHDPCYLGRYNNSYNVPRDVFALIMASDIKEMPRSLEESFCCGAGGGNFWRGKASGRRMEEMRIEEALQTEANGIITACPFCDIMFGSAVKQKGMEYSFAVTNIVTLANKATA